MSERVRPDVVDAVLPEDAFYLSNILRVIDEEIEDCLSDADSDGAGALSALRDRFEEADDE